MQEVIQTEKIFVTDDDIRELRKRNEARARKMIEEMGSKWLLHPDNRVTLSLIHI